MYAWTTDQLLALGERRFDAAVCNMAMMDMAEIDPMLFALSRILKRKGRFVFSLMHPCFNAGSKITIEVEDRAGEIVEVYAVKVAKYLGLAPPTGCATSSIVEQEGKKLTEHVF
jgi:ubiquinone/menaquinone biosynthesis C-methylase UbiE